MFNSGIRGKRASDNTGTVASQSQFIQQQYPQPSITGYSIVGTDDTALNPAGGQTVLVNGTGFASGAAVTVNGITISPVTVVSPTQLSFTSTALAGGSYTLIVYNSTGGAAILVPGLIYSAVPTWTTSAGSIGTYYETIAINSNVVATSDSAITYSLSSGSLPSGATLYGNGVITGTSPVESGSTTYTFAIKAEDAELQDTTRTFTLTINTDVVTWSAPADGTTYTANINEVASNVVLSATSAAGYNVSYAANTLPTGLSLAGNTISGTPTVVGNSATLLTATASTTNRNATRTINWIIQLGSDPYFYATSLLLNGESTSTYWIQDASTNGFTVTVNGDAKPVAFSPYEIVWSSFFDGSGDYLTVADNAALESFTDFTIEFWVYFNSVSGTQVILDKGWNNASIAPYLIFSSNDSLVVYASSNGSGWDVISGSSFGTFVTARWYHIALTRSGSSIRLFRDGSLITTVTNSSTIWNNSSALGIGASPMAGANPFNGYISNLRIVKGTAVYTSAFIPPTAPLTAIANTSLLTCQSNRFIDNSTNNFTITRNGDTSVRNFGPFVETDVITGSGYFDGTGDYLTVADNVALRPGTGDFTYECWYYPITVVGTTEIISKGVGFQLYTNGTGIGLAVSSNNTSSYYINNTVGFMAVNTWHHIAVVRSGNSYLGFVNGAMLTIGTSSSSPDTGTDPLIIGGYSGGTFLITGYLSNVRFVKGTAVYTSAFTPPTSPLTAIANTSLLTLQSRIGETNNIFVDASGINNLITRNGNTTQGTFSPFSQTGWSGYFTGSSTSYISTPSTTILNQGQTYTVQCWIYPTSFTTSTSAVRRMYIFVKGVIYAGLSIHSDGTLGWYGWPTPGGIIVASPAGTITTNVWQHVALVVYPSNYIKLFKNGTEVGTAGYTAAGADGSAIIIGHGDTGQSTDGFIGYISNFKITLSALTGGQLDYSATPTISSSTGTSLLVLQTNRFNDTSPNNLTITPAAAASIQSFSPFASAINTPISYSGYSDGTGDYLTWSGTTLSGDFTAECWVYKTAVNVSGYTVVFGGPGNQQFSIDNTTAGSISLVLAGVGVIGASGTAVTLNAWHHLAYVRQGSTCRAYVNGVQRGTGTSSASVAISFIGQYDQGGYGLTGCISNVRVVAGTCLYPDGTTFTPSTSPLTAITNTSLLTCQSSTFIDNSTNNFTITVNGDAKPLAFNPFGTTSLTGSNAVYSIANVGGSMYFDGSGDHLTVALGPNTYPPTTTTPFTIDLWLYPISYNTPILGLSNQISSIPYFLGFGSIYGTIDTTNKIWFGTYGGGWAGVTSTAGAVPLNTWSHVAAVYTGSVMRLYINGVLNVTATQSISVNASNYTLYVGQRWDGAISTPYYGYMSDVRIVIGRSLYASSFAPPVSPAGAVSGTKFFVTGTNSGLIDYTSKTDLETAGSSKLSTTIKKFGSASMYFDGTDDYLLISPTTNLEFGSANFTIEFWWYPTSTTRQALYHGSFGTDWSIGIDYSSVSTNQKIGIWASSNGTSWNLINADGGGNGIGTTTVTQNAWNHIAYVRNGTTWMLFVNGNRDLNLTGISGSIVNRSTSPKVIGAWWNTTAMSEVFGYIDDFRVTTGIARYTANFTPPTQAFITF